MAASSPTAMCARHFRLRAPSPHPAVPPRLPTGTSTSSSSRLPPRRLAVSPRAEAGTGTGDLEALRSGVAVYKPRSYEVLVSDAARSLACALDDGKTRLEIEFPPLPSSISSYKGSSDEFIDANIQLALTVARKLKELKGTRSCIVFPDQPEKRRASQLFRTAIDTIEGVTVSSLDDVPTGPVNNFFKSIRNTLDFDFSDDNEGLSVRPWSGNHPSTPPSVSCPSSFLLPQDTFMFIRIYIHIHIRPSPFVADANHRSCAAPGEAPRSSPTQVPIAGSSISDGRRVRSRAACLRPASCVSLPQVKQVQ